MNKLIHLPPITFNVEWPLCWSDTDIILARNLPSYMAVLFPDYEVSEKDYESLNKDSTITMGQWLTEMTKREYVKLQKNN